MKGDIRVITPSRADWGFQMTVSDSDGRVAEARYTITGQRNMWEMTSRH